MREMFDGYGRVLADGKRAWYGYGDNIEREVGCGD